MTKSKNYKATKLSIQSRVLGDEMFFPQISGEPTAKTKIVPFKTKGVSIGGTTICISQDGDFVLLSPKTLQDILKWFSGS